MTAHPSLLTVFPSWPFAAPPEQRTLGSNALKYAACQAHKKSTLETHQAPLAACSPG